MSDDGLSKALREFQELLSPAEAAELARLSSHAPKPEDVVNFASQITEKSKTRSSRIVATRLQTFLGSIQQYCTIVDTFVGPNQIAAAIWGSIKLALLVTSNFVEYFEKLSERIAQLSAYCPRLEEYKKLFNTSTRVQDALSGFYTVVVEFCSKALSAVKEKGVKRFSKSIWKSFKLDFKELEERISEAKEEVTQELELASEQEAHGFRRLMITEVAESRALRIKQEAEIDENKRFRSQQILAREQAESRRNWKILKIDERRKIRLLEKIPGYDYILSLHRARGLRCAGTCTWLLEKLDFQKWMDQTGPKHLWCYGIPGCGKTVLLGYIIDHLKKIFSEQKETVIIYYFFDSSDKKSLKQSTFLRCILHQAIKLESLFPDIQTRLESLFLSETERPEPATATLEELFLKFCRTHMQYFLLIDGLDEADAADQRDVKHFLKEVQKIKGAHILATTHAAVDMSKVFAPGSTLQIKPEDLEADIETFIQSQIEKHSQDELLGCPRVVLDTIKQKLVHDTEGMFLWADLQFKAILNVCEEDGTPNRIPDLLETLPRKITDLYSFLLGRIAKGASEQAERARKAFQWVLYSERSLTMSELEDAISIAADQKSWKAPSAKLDRPKLGKLCGNLINYDELTKTVSLAHHTVESFLLDCFDKQEVASFAIEGIKVQQYLAGTCLTYLSFMDFHRALTRRSDNTSANPMHRPVAVAESVAPTSIQPFLSMAFKRRQSRRAEPLLDLSQILRNQLDVVQSNTTNAEFRLLDYCKRYWHDHSRYIDLQGTERETILRNFIQRTDLPKEWIPWSSIKNLELLPLWNIFIWTVRNGHMAIFALWQSFADHEECNYWKYLWQNELQEKVRDNTLTKYRVAIEGEVLLLSACETPNLVQLEIILNAKRRKQSDRPREEDLVKMLIEACSNGHAEVVERLLQEGADVNAPAAKWGKTALQADVPAAAAEGYTALQVAALGGHLAVVERLLQEGADVNAPAAELGRTALQAAAAGGHLAVVKRLLQEGADVNAPAVKWGKTALQAAAWGGHLAVVEWLLQEADVNAPAAAAAVGYTALQAAAEGGRLAVVERLLQEGADINAPAPAAGGYTALQGAALGGHLAVVERLLQEGADVNAPAAELGRTALQAAAWGGHLAVVERLLQEGAIVNAPAPAVGYTALQAAKICGHYAVAERLRQAGAKK